ncbi:MAG: M50 family metallopeptidase [Myxococcales bacterium]|nr:M50 family metallopeptidase [Myxococcales bacterium]
MKTASGAALDAKRLFALAACFFAGIWLWDWEGLWPLKLLVVMVHETGHAAASLIVGGSVNRITIAADQSGQCLSSIPLGFLAKVTVYSAGYVGSALVGAALLLLTFRFRARRVVLGAACAWLALMGLFYAGDLFTLLFCLGTALAFGLGARFLPQGAVEVVNLFLAAFSSLYAAMDLKDDLWNSAVRAQSDAALLADLTIVPAVVWAALWTIFSIAVLAMAAYWSVRRARVASPGAGLPSRFPSP